MRMSAEADHYLKIWHLSRPQELTRTATSCVYTVVAAGGPAILKVLTPLGMKDEKASAMALGHFNGQGAVRLLGFDDGAQLLEYAAGDDLTVLVRSGRDAEATATIGDLLNRLHGAASPVP